MKYYVYLHRDINGIVFYIGKGCGNRYKVKCIKRSIQWKKIASDGYTFEIIKDNLNEIEALELETNLIENPEKDWKLINVLKSSKIKYLDYNLMNELFYYDESSPSGLRWKVNNRRGVSLHKCVGSLRTDTNSLPLKWVVGINGKIICIHRIIYLLHNPNFEQSLLINHIDFNPSNNKINNLELVNKSENNRKIAAKDNVRLKSNNKSGFTGISEHITKGLSYTVAFYSINGKLYRKFFSHDKLGKEQAVALAKEWRTINVKDEK